MRTKATNEVTLTFPSLSRNDRGKHKGRFISYAAGTVLICF